MSYRVLPHTADVALEIYGRTWREFYLSAAAGLRAIYRPIGKSGKKELKRCRVREDSPEGVLVAWLNEMIFLISANRWFPEQVRLVDAGPTGLSAELTGGPMGSGRRRAVAVCAEVKSATFSDLAVRRYRGRWRARVVLDV